MLGVHRVQGLGFRVVRGFMPYRVQVFGVSGS